MILQQFCLLALQTKYIILELFYDNRKSLWCRWTYVLGRFTNSHAILWIKSFIVLRRVVFTVNGWNCSILADKMLNMSLISSTISSKDLWNIQKRNSMKYKQENNCIKWTHRGFGFCSIILISSLNSLSSLSISACSVPGWSFCIFAANDPDKTSATFAMFENGLWKIRKI